MAIKIIEEPDIYLTQAEHGRLSREYQQAISFHANPPSFETWVRARKAGPITSIVPTASPRMIERCVFGARRGPRAGQKGAKE